MRKGGPATLLTHNKSDCMNNLAGIDVSKGKSMVSVLRPFGEVVALPFTVQHTPSEAQRAGKLSEKPGG